MTKILGYISLVLILLCQACANQVNLTGGPRDERPPQLDTVKSFANEQLRFEKQDIQLFFDEYVEIRDASKQLVVSPPLSQPPKLTSRLKRVTFAFDEDEVLKENTTYVINFGSSIRDFTEGNKLENFTRVFSTGDQIDSLELSGTITDALTGDPAKECLVLLYIEDRDSIVYQEKPYYFAKTDDNGAFTVKNLRADTFKIVALKDENLNYLYDTPAELIGFLDSTIMVSCNDSTPLDLTVFKEDGTAKYLGYEAVAKGRIEVEFDQTPDLSQIIRIDSAMGRKLLTSTIDKKVNLWYDDRGSTRQQWLIYGDTISMRIPKNTDALDTTVTISRMDQNTVHPDQSITFKTNHPVATIDTSQIMIIDTTAKDTLGMRYDLDTAQQTITISPDKAWPEAANLSISWLPGSVTDMWGHTIDTTQQMVTIGSRTDYGTISLAVDSIPAGDSFVIQLMKGEKVIEHFKTINTDTVLTISPLLPDSYSVKIIEDANGNGRWDSGNYLQKKQPEKIYKEIKLDELRENWILDERLNMTTIKQENE